MKPKASFAHVQIKFNNILIRNQWEMSSQNWMSSLVWEFLIITDKLLLIC